MSFFLHQGGKVMSSQIMHAQSLTLYYAHAPLLLLLFKAQVLAGRERMINPLSIRRPQPHNTNPMNEEKAKTGNKKGASR